MHRIRAAQARLAGLSIAALAMLFAGATVAAADLYKWTDDKGIVHYSDTPPSKDRKASQRVRLTGTESPSADPAAETAKQPAGDGSVPVASVEAQDKRKRVCEQERSTLELLQGDGPLADATSGKPLAASERAERLATAQRTVAMYCQKSS